MKKILRNLTLLSISVLLASCGSNEKEAGTSPESSDPDTLTMWVQFSEEDPEGYIMEEAIDEFNETNEDELTVEVQYIPRSSSGGGYEDKLNAALTTDTLPDVFTLDGPNTAAYADSGMLQPIEDYISDIDDLLPSIIKAGTYEDKLYSVSYSESSVGFFYNIDMLEDAGIDIDSLPTVDNPWTWNEFNDMLEQLYNNNNKEPILDMNFGDHSEWLTYAFSPFVWSAGGDIVSSDGTESVGYFDSSETIKAFEFIQKLVEDGYSDVSSIDKGFHTGKYALYMGGSYTIQELDSEYKDINYGIMPYPVSPDTKELVSPTGSWAYGMSATTSNPEGAGKLINFLVSEDQLYNMSVGDSVLPARESVADRMYEEVDEPMQVLIDQNRKSGKSRPVLINYPQISRAFQEAVTESTYYEQNKDLKALLELKAQEIEGYLE